MEIVTHSRGTAIAPFWNRIPAFFLYGLKPIPLLLATLSGVLVYITSSIWVSIILYAVGVKYSMAALQHTLKGELSPPPLSSEVIVQGYELPLFLFFILLIYILGLGSLASSFSPLLALLFLLLGVFLFPALILCLGISESFSFSLNPFHWLALVKSIGWPYLALYGLYLSFSGAQSSLEYFILDGVSSTIQAPSWMTINTLFMIISFHMLGYVALQYHRELQLHTPPAVADEEKNDSPLLERFIAQGNTAAAIEELACLVNDHPADLDLRKKLHNYAMLNQDYRTVSRYAPAYLQMLTEAGSYAAAAQLFSDCQRASADCHPTRPECYLPLFEILKQRGSHKDAVALAKNFHSRFPESNFIPAIYFELAKLFSENMQRDDLAIKLLQFIIRHYSSYEKITEVNQYLKLLKTLDEQT